MCHIYNGNGLNVRISEAAGSGFLKKCNVILFFDALDDFDVLVTLFVNMSLLNYKINIIKET
jgi:hypothetical protein